MSKRTIKVRVAEGATLLDKQRPGWWNDIDLDRLDMGRGDACILGQLTDGSFMDGLERYMPDGYLDDGERFCDWSDYYGFDAAYECRDSDGYVELNPREYVALRAAWSLEITRRRNMEHAQESA